MFMCITGEVYGMRIEHWCLIAAGCLIMSNTGWTLKWQLQQKLAYTRTCYNQMSDNAVEDGLYAGLFYRDGKVYLDEEKAILGFETSLLRSFDESKESQGGKKLLNSIQCLVILEEEEFIVRANGVTKRYSYGNSVTESVNTKIQEELHKNTDTKKYQVDFPIVREDACHTLSGISMICIMHFPKILPFEQEADRYFVSAARATE